MEGQRQVPNITLSRKHAEGLRSLAMLPILAGTESGGNRYTDAIGSRVASHWISRTRAVAFTAVDAGLMVATAHMKA